MKKKIVEIQKRLATIEMRLNTHWALQTDQEFADNYVQRAKNDLQALIFKMAIGVIVLMAGVGYIFIDYAVYKRFDAQNKQLVEGLKSSYNEQIEMINNNFTWRKFHDYGKYHVYLADIYFQTPILKRKEKEKNIMCHLKEAKGYFKQALRHGDMKSSTYWELGELCYTYPKKMQLTSWIDRNSAIENYISAVNLYKKAEIETGWQAEACAKIGEIYLDISESTELNGPDRKRYQEKAKEYLIKAKNNYTTLVKKSDEIKQNKINEINKMLKKITTTNKLSLRLEKIQRWSVYQLEPSLINGTS